MILPEDSRIIVIRPCCIGDVVQATVALAALRRRYPRAHITVAVGSWSRAVLDHHPAVDAIVDTGPRALPVKHPLDFWRFVRLLRRGRYDAAISLVRSPLMSAAVLLSGIPVRAGIDSAGRGFGYTLRAPVDPSERRHEAEIYLEVVRLLDVDTRDAAVNVPVTESARAAIQQKLHTAGVSGPCLVINPTGGSNPGALLSSKRWPPAQFAALADALAPELGAAVILLGGPSDQLILQAVQSAMQQAPAAIFAGGLGFDEIAALAADSLLYIGNDTGLTHLAAAAGARTAAIFGPSDPRRYAPYTPHSLALWKPVRLAEGGVASAGHDTAFDWAHDGIGPDEALTKIRAFLQN